MLAASISDIIRGSWGVSVPEIKQVVSEPIRTATEPNEPVQKAAATGMGDAIFPSWAQEKIRPQRNDAKASRSTDRDDFVFTGSFDIKLPSFHTGAYIMHI